MTNMINRRVEPTAMGGSLVTLTHKRWIYDRAPMSVVIDLLSDINYYPATL